MILNSSCEMSATEFESYIVILKERAKRALSNFEAIIAAKPHYDRELVTSDLQRAWFPNR